MWPQPHSVNKLSYAIEREFVFWICKKMDNFDFARHVSVDHWSSSLQMCFWKLSRNRLFPILPRRNIKCDVTRWVGAPSLMLSLDKLLKAWERGLGTRLIKCCRLMLQLFKFTMTQQSCDVTTVDHRRTWVDRTFQSTTLGWVLLMTLRSSLSFYVKIFLPLVLLRKTRAQGGGGTPVTLG